MIPKKFANFSDKIVRAKQSMVPKKPAEKIMRLNREKDVRLIQSDAIALLWQDLNR